MDQPEPNRTPEDKRKITSVKAFSIAGEFGFIIALPIIIFGYLGKLLDQRYGTHFLVLIGLLLALATSTAWLYKSIKDILKDLRNQ